GFGLRLRAGGSAVWVYQYKLGRRSRRMTLGSLAALTPEAARKSAGKLQATVRLGRDPSADKTETRPRANENMHAVLLNHLAFQRGVLKPRSMIETERHLTKNARSLHDMPLAAIDRRAIAGLLSTVASERGGPTANRMRAALSKFFSWCIREGLLENN